MVSGTIGNSNDRAVDMGVSTENEPNVIKEARNECGRHFGICGSYHHLKACMCKYCTSYPGGSGMFCSKGKSSRKGEKVDCNCEFCELQKKLGIEGKFFCRQD